jgi:hypothetical protein
LTIPLLSELYKPFFSACTLNVTSQAPLSNGASMEKPTPHKHTNALRGEEFLKHKIVDYKKREQF